MRTISAVVDIAAAPQHVWAVLADLDAYQDWNPFIQSASGQLTKGSTLRLRMVPEHGDAHHAPALAGGAARRAAALDRPPHHGGGYSMARTGSRSTIWAVAPASPSREPAVIRGAVALSR